MGRVFIPLGVALPAAFLWCLVVAFALRFFGLRLGFGLPSRKEDRSFNRLSALQYGIFAGAAMWGVGMVIALTMNDYVCWKLWPGEYPMLRARDLVGRCVVCPLAGFLLALLLRRRYGSRRSRGDYAA